MTTQIIIKRKRLFQKPKPLGILVIQGSITTEQLTAFQKAITDNINKTGVVAIANQADIEAVKYYKL